MDSSSSATPKKSSRFRKVRGLLSSGKKRKKKNKQSPSNTEASDVLLHNQSDERNARSLYHTLSDVEDDSDAPFDESPYKFGEFDPNRNLQQEFTVANYSPEPKQQPMENKAWPSDEKKAPSQDPRHLLAIPDLLIKQYYGDFERGQGEEEQSYSSSDDDGKNLMMKQYDGDFEREKDQEEQSYSSDGGKKQVKDASADEFSDSERPAGSLLESDSDSVYVDDLPGTDQDPDKIPIEQNADSDSVYVDDMSGTDQDPDKIPIERNAGIVSDDESDGVQLEEDVDQEESTEASENDTNSDASAVKEIELDGDPTGSTPVEGDSDVLELEKDVGRKETIGDPKAEPMEESMEPSDEGDPDQTPIVNPLEQYADQVVSTGPAADTIYVDDMPGTDQDPDKIPIERNAGIVSDDESDGVQLEEDSDQQESREAFEDDTNSDPAVKEIELDGDPTGSTPVEGDSDVLQLKEDTGRKETIGDPKAEPMEESMEPSDEGDPDQTPIVNPLEQYADQVISTSPAADTFQTEGIVEPSGDDSDPIESTSQGESDASRECTVDADQEGSIGICNTTAQTAISNPVEQPSDETEATSISEEEVDTEENVPIEPSTVDDNDILDRDVDQLEHTGSSEAGETMERIGSDNEHANSTDRTRDDTDQETLMNELQHDDDGVAVTKTTEPSGDHAHREFRADSVEADTDICTDSNVEDADQVMTCLKEIGSESHADQMVVHGVDEKQSTIAFRDDDEQLTPVNLFENLVGDSFPALPLEDGECQGDRVGNDNIQIELKHRFDDDGQRGVSSIHLVDEDSEPKSPTSSLEDKTGTGTPTTPVDRTDADQTLSTSPFEVAGEGKHMAPLKPLERDLRQGADQATRTGNVEGGDDKETTGPSQESSDRTPCQVPLQENVQHHVPTDPLDDTVSQTSSGDSLVDEAIETISNDKGGEDTAHQAPVKRIEEDATSLRVSTNPFDDDQDRSASMNPSDARKQFENDSDQILSGANAIPANPFGDDPNQTGSTDSSERFSSEPLSEEEDETVKETGTRTRDKEELSEERNILTVKRAASSTPPPAPTEDRIRAVNHEKLLDFESMRQLQYSEKLESVSLKWQSTLDLIRLGLNETARAERVVLSSILANQAYGEAMQAIYEDVFLDDEGNTVGNNTVVGAWRQNRLSTERSHKDYTLVLVPEEGAWRDNVQTPEERRGGMLTSLIDVQSVLAQRFTENVKNEPFADANEISHYRKQLEPQVRGIARLGKAIVSELKLAEKRVTETWDSYVKIFGGTLIVTSPPLTPKKQEISTPPASISPTGGAAFSPFSSLSPKRSTLLESCSDIWLAEMRYRIAAMYQRELWEKASPRLLELVDSVAEKEFERRSKLHEMLLDFLPRQRRLLSSFTSSHSPVLQELVERQMDQEVEEDVHETIQKHSKIVQMKETEHKSSIINRSRRKGVQDVSDIEELESPLASELLFSMKVIERKIKGADGNTRWRRALAVVTLDSYMFLFDMPPTSESVSEPEKAFEELVPVPVEDIQEWTPQGSKGCLKNLLPVESAFLPDCTLSKSKDNAREFEIAETRTGRFGRSVEWTLVLRTESQEETTKWIDTKLETKMWPKANLESQGLREYVVV